MQIDFSLRVRQHTPEMVLPDTTLRLGPAFSPATPEVRFSVVVCTYNYAHLLPDTLRTLAAQSLLDFELLIVDDGSSDNTKDVVARFGPDFHGLRYLHKAHTGLADTRNVGIRAAEGTNIAFLDADDLWSPRYLETMRRAFTDCPQADLIFCDGFAFHNNGVLVETDTRPHLPYCCGPIHSAQELFPFINAFCPSGMAFSKSLYNRVGAFDVGFDEGMGDDLDWVFRALLAGAYCVCLNQRLYLYRRHSDNLSNYPDRFLRAWLKIYTRTLKTKVPNRQIDSLARRFTRSCSLRLLAFGPAQDGRRWLQAALEALGGDLTLRLLYASTFLGSAGLLRLVRIIRNRIRGLRRRNWKIDLSASPEAIFDALPK